MVCEPVTDGAALRMFILSPFGHWVAQDVERWGMPQVLRYSNERTLAMECRRLVSAMKALVPQLDLWGGGPSAG